nr:kinesin-like protein KIN-12B [Tanacetum cinerariifolium]
MNKYIKSVEIESSTQHGPVNGIVQHQPSSKSYGQPNLSLAKGKGKLDEYVNETMHIGITYETVQEGHARMLEQYADIEEKHINLLTSQRRFEDGILDVKKAAAKDGVKSAKSKDKNKGLQAQLRDMAEAVQAAIELLVRLKEAEEVVAAAEYLRLLFSRYPCLCSTLCCGCRHGDGDP